jgi:hypothetical protein
MTERDPRRRPLPPPLVLGLVLTTAYLLFAFVDQGGPGLPHVGRAVAAGLATVGQVQLAYGLFMLADRHTGAVRRALHVAAAAAVGSLVLQLVGELSIAFHVRWWQTPGLSFVMEYGFLAATLGSAIGLAVAAWRHSRALGAAILVIWIGSLLTTTFIGSLGLGYPAFMVLQLALRGIRLAGLAAVVVALAGEPQAVDSARVGGDLRRTARVLRVAVAGMIGVTAALVLLASCGGGHRVAESVVWALAVVLGVVVFTWLGLALLGAARERGTAIAPYPLALAGTLALACSRLLLAVLPELYCSSLPRDHSELSGMALVVVPVTAVVGAAVLAWTISAFARRSGLDELRHRAALHAGGVLAALVVGPLTLVKLVDYSASAAVLFVVVVCVVQVVLLARLCVAAAVAVDRRSELPEARLIRA